MKNDTINRKKDQKKDQKKSEKRSFQRERGNFFEPRDFFGKRENIFHDFLHGGGKFILFTQTESAPAPQ